MNYDTHYEDDGGETHGSCEICGSNQFSSQGGFYYCSECNTQSQHTREYVEDDNQQIQRGSSSATVAVLGNDRRKKKRLKPPPKSTLSSWEVHNMVLKAMTDKLISIGFPEHLLRDKVFQLWKTYLLKRNVIFCEDDLNPLNSASCVTSGEPKTNLMTFYKWRNAIRRKYAPKRKFTLDNALARKMAERKLRKKAFESSYLASHTDEDLPPGVGQDNKNGPVVFPHVKLTPTAAKVYQALKTLKRKSKKKFVQVGPRDRWTNRVLRHEVFSYHKVLVLLFIACRQIGCRVLYTDLIRLLNEGTLFVNSLHSILGYEEGSNYVGWANNFLATKFLGVNPVKIGCTIQPLLDYIGVNNFQYPKFQEFLPKFVQDCSLPLEFESCLNQLYKMYPEEDHILDLELESFPLKIMIEILIVSMIGLFLRMLFGLDDVTEKHQSRFAAKVNGILSRHLNPEESLDPRTEWTQLFDIKEWFRHIRYRTSFAEQEKLNPIQFRHGKPPNLTRLSDISTRYATPGIEVEAPSTEVLKVEDEDEIQTESLLVALDGMKCGNVRRSIAASHLKGIFQSATIKEHGGAIPEVSDYISLPYPNQTTVEEFQSGKPNVSYPAYDSSLLYADFGKKRIDYIFNPEKYIPLLEKAGYKVKVLPGTLPQYKKVMKVKRRRLLLFQPYKKVQDAPGWYSPAPASMQFVLDHLSRYIYVNELYGKDYQNRHHVLHTIEKLTHLYSLRSLNGFIPLAK